MKAPPVRRVGVPAFFLLARGLGKYVLDLEGQPCICSSDDSGFSDTKGLNLIWVLEARRTLGAGSEGGVHCVGGVKGQGSGHAGMRLLSLNEKGKGNRTEDRKMAYN